MKVVNISQLSNIILLPENHSTLKFECSILHRKASSRVVQPRLHCRVVIRSIARSLALSDVRDRIITCDIVLQK